MTLVATLLLAFGMSMDAFAASIGKGAALHKPAFREALRTGAIFGAVEAIIPVIGWALGLAASRYVTAWDHWLAFVLLGILGGRMIHQGLSRREADGKRSGKHSFAILVATATSLDAMAVGIGLAFLDVDILGTATAIGLATLIMATTGVLVGRFLGPLVGRAAEVIGGVILIGIGAGILFEHLSA